MLVVAENESTTSVEFQLTLRNGGTATILTDYYLNVGSLPLKNVRLLTPAKDLSLRYETQSNNNQLHFRFAHRSLKRGDAAVMRVSATVDQLWEKRGLIQVIRLPFQLSGFSEESRIILRVTRQLGTLLYSTHPYDQSNIEGNYNVYAFPISSFRNASFAFGKEQVYSVFSAYDLENTSAEVQEQQVILPSFGFNNLRQLVDRINPLPNTSNMLTEGNIRAVYALQPAEKRRVAVGFKYYFNNERLPKTKLTAEQQSQYRATTGVLQAPLEIVRRTQASTVLAGNRPPSEQITAVTNWLTKNYSLSPTALQQYTNHDYVLQHTLTEVVNAPNGRITNAYEAPVLWLAACRWKEVPCRLVYGVVYSYISTNNRASSMQVWGQYYDSSLERWVDVDPLLAMATKLSAYHLELTHIPLFEIDPNRENTHITEQFYEATFETQVPTAVEELSVQASTPVQKSGSRPFWEASQTELTISVINNGNTPVAVRSLDFAANNLVVKWDGEAYAESVLYPGSSIQIPVTFEIAPRLTPALHQVELIGKAEYTDHTVDIAKKIQLSQQVDIIIVIIYYVILGIIGIAGVLVLLFGFRFFNGWLRRRIVVNS